MSSKPNPFGSSTEAIYQTLVRSALPLSTNDIFQSLVSKGLFQDVPAKNARLDIAAKLRSLKTRGVISRMDEKVGNQMWQLDPETRAALPPEKTAKPVKPKAATKPTAKLASAPARIESPACYVLRDLLAWKPRFLGMAAMLEAIEAGVLHLTHDNLQDLHGELLQALLTVENEMEMPF